jgi:hypothetical protein
MEYDVFISHAGEDREALVGPLATILEDLGVRVWYADFSLRAGDSLVRSIDRGLAAARFGLVVLSKAFLVKPWPECELRGLAAKELGRDKVIIPIWHRVSREEIIAFSPPLADKLALETSRSSLAQLAVKIVEIVRPDIFGHLVRWLEWQRRMRHAKREVVPRSELKLGPIRRETLPPGVVVRCQIVLDVLKTAMQPDLAKFTENLRRDVHYREELEVWEHIAAAYLRYTSGRRLSVGTKREVLSALLGCSFGMLPGAANFTRLDDAALTAVVECWKAVAREAGKSAKPAARGSNDAA